MTITQAIGLATETDLAQAFSKVKRKTLGLATETDLAQRISHIAYNDFANAQVVTGNSSQFFDPINMVNSGLETDEVYFAGVLGTAWFYWDTPGSPLGELYISCGGQGVNNTNYDVTLRIFKQMGSGLAGLVEVEAYRGDQNPSAANTDAEAYFLTTPSQRYYFQVGTKQNDLVEGFFHWDANPSPSAPANDNFASRTSIFTSDPPTVDIDSRQLTVATSQAGEDTDYGIRSVWYEVNSGHDETVNQIIHISTDSVGGGVGLGAVDDHTLRLYYNADGTIPGLLRIANNDSNLNGGASEIGAKVKWAQSGDFAPFNALVLRTAVRGEGYLVYTNFWTAPEEANNGPFGAIALVDALTLTVDSTNSSLTVGELDDLEIDDPTSPYQGSLWYSYGATGTTDVTFTATHDGVLHPTAPVRIKIYSGTPTPVDPLDEDFLSDLAGLTEIEDSGDGAPLATVVLSDGVEGDTYFIQLLTTLDTDHTLTWSIAGAEGAVEIVDPTATGSLAGNADVQLIFASHADLAVQGSVVTTTPIRVRPMLGVEIEMPTPAIVNGKPIVPLYWSKPASSMTATVGVGHIVVVPDADPASQPGGASVTDNWPAGGKPDYWWTVRDLSDPGAGNFTHLSSWPEHFGGPSLTSSGIYRPRLQHRDHFGAGGRKHTYTKSVVFNPDQVDHMWVDLGSNLAQPYTVMMAGIILSYPKRTYGHYLLDAGRATPIKNTDKDWTIDDNLAYRSLMLFQLHSALICTRDDTDDGVIARVPHNYRLTPRVFMGIFHGNSSRVGYFDTREKKVAKGRTDNHSVRRLVIGRRTNKISDNLASHMVLFEVRIWSAHLTPKQYRAQYKQMAALYKFNLYDKDGV